MPITPDGCMEWIGWRNESGYGNLTVSCNDQWKHRRAHRLSYEHFVGPIPADCFICHKCDNPRCVRPDHLFAGTHQENMQDMVRKGRQAIVPGRGCGDRNGSRLYPEKRPRGEQNSQAKLTECQVREILAKHAEGAITAAQLSRDYNVSKVLVGLIVKRKAWKHVTDSTLILQPP